MDQYTLQSGSDELALVLGQQPEPRPLGDLQVIVRIMAASLNYRDLLCRGDLEGTRQGLVPLSDGAGEVIEVGSGVTRWRPGDRVSPAFFPKWRSGPFRPEYLAEALGGSNTEGVLQSLFVAHEDALVRIPDRLSFAEAATLPCAGVTAWHALFERDQVGPDHTILVQGTGGVSIIALQLAHAAGAKVIVTSSSDAKLAIAKSMGAWAGVNYKTVPDWDKAVLDLTDGRGADHILELGGPDTYNRSINCLAFGGTISQIGVLTGFGSKPDITPLQFKNGRINGICVGSVEHFERLMAFVEDHAITPRVSKTFKWSGAAEAYEALKHSDHFGKVVINIQDHS